MSDTRGPPRQPAAIAELTERIDAIETSLAEVVAMLAGILQKAEVLPAQDFARKLLKCTQVAEEERPGSASARQFRRIADAVGQLASAAESAADQQSRIRSHPRVTTDASEKHQGLRRKAPHRSIDDDR